MTESVNNHAINLLGALALRLIDAQADAVEAVLGMGGEAAAAVIAVGEFPGERVSFFAPILGLTDAGTVRLIARLEDKRLIRRASGADRRSQALHLTVQGRTAARRIRDARRQILTEATAPLGPEAIRELGELLEPVIAALPGERTAARRMCRLCDHEVCDGAKKCPADHALTAAGVPGWPGPP